MTQQTLAIIALALWSFSLLPGSVFQKPKPRLDPQSPHLYVAVVREVAILMLLIWLVTA